MAKAVDIIKYEGYNSTFIWKYPLEDFNALTQLTVHESQEAIFFMNGQALDLFGPGRYTLGTQNLPILGKLLNRITGGDAPFHSEVYFINKTEQMADQVGHGQQWGLADIFRGLNDLRDSANLTVECSRLAREKILADAAAAEAAAKKRAKIKCIVTLSVTGAILMAVAIALLTVFVFIPSSKYSKAEKYLQDGEYAESYLAFMELGNYKDSAARAEELKQDHPGVYRPGDTVVYGAFEQDADSGNGKEDLEWIVLANEDGKLLLISKHVLHAKEYNDDGRAAYWSFCSLRSWLNGDFLAAAFDQTQMEGILPTTLENKDNSVHDTTGGEETEDKVFLLSCEEFEQYFTDADGAADATQYALQSGALTVGDAGAVWWLRSPGYGNGFGACVSENGYINYYGSTVYSVRGVRPAIWVEAEALDVETEEENDAK